MQLEPLLVQERADPSQRRHCFFCALHKQDHARTILRKSQGQYAKLPWYTATSPVSAVEVQAANRRNQVAQKSGRTGSVLTYPVPMSEISMHVVSVCLSTSHLFERKLMQGFSLCSLLKVVLLKRRILRPVNAIDQAYSKPEKNGILIYHLP